MSQFNSQVQISYSENRQHSPVSTPYSPLLSHVSHESSTANGEALHVTYVAQSQVQTPVEINHPNDFFFRPPYDYYHYRVTYKEISYDTIEYLSNKSLNGNNVSFNENECTFVYHQKCNGCFY